jgi:hypothetical protein
MLPRSTDPLLSLREEGSRCKASLQAFTENLIAKLGVSQPEAEKLRQCGNMYLHFPFCFLEAFAGIAVEDVRTMRLERSAVDELHACTG